MLRIPTLALFVLSLCASGCASAPSQHSLDALAWTQTSMEYKANARQAYRAAQAMLDVHDPEPFGPAYPLLDIANVHLAPHIAAATERAKVSMSWVVRDVARVLAGETPENPAPA